MHCYNDGDAARCSNERKRGAYLHAFPLCGNDPGGGRGPRRGRRRRQRPQPRSTKFNDVCEQKGKNTRFRRVLLTLLLSWGFPLANASPGTQLMAFSSSSSVPLPPRYLCTHTVEVCPPGQAFLLLFFRNPSLLFPVHAAAKVGESFLHIEVSDRPSEKVFSPGVSFKNITYGKKYLEIKLMQKPHNIHETLLNMNPQKHIVSIVQRSEEDSLRSGRKEFLHCSLSPLN